VFVSNNGIEFSKENILFDFRGHVSITHVHPRFGSTYGNLLVTIKTINLHLTSKLGCRFDDNDVAATFIGNHTLL